jgi:serine/threonine protein kinase
LDERLHQLAKRMEAALDEDPSVDLGGLLPPSSAPRERLIALHEMIKIELELRWGQNRPVTLEEYMRRFPELGPAAILPVDLIHEEYCARHRYGDRPPLEDYKKRFPEQYAQLVQKVRSHPDVTCAKTNIPFTRILPGAGAEPVPGYQLVRRLGQGGFGEVWQATGPGGFPVAMKFIRLGAPSGNVELRALELMKHLRHPNLLGQFGAWRRDETLIVAMELAEGTLLSRLERAVGAGLPGIPADELLEYMADAARGIDYLNEPRPAEGQPHGIQHRDIKPANLLLVGGCVKVADIGLPKVLQNTMASNTGSMTLAYSAPECINGATSHRSDQYSLAVSYCHLRGNRLPFRGTAQQVMFGHLMNPPDLAMLPAAEQAVVARALAKKPEDRWPNCQAFCQALGEALGIRRANPRSPGRTLSVPSASMLSVPLGLIKAGLDRLRRWRTGNLLGETSTEAIRTPARPERPPGESPSWPKVIRRHTDVAFPARIPVSKVGTLRIQLVPAEEFLPTGEVREIRPPHPHDATLTLKAPRPEEPDESLPLIRLTVSVAAENFTIEGDSRAELVVPLGGKSSTLHFRLRGQKAGPGRIMVDFMQHGRPVGSVDLYPEVVRRSPTRALTLAAWPTLLAALAAINPQHARAVAPPHEPSRWATPSIFDPGAALWYSLGSLGLLCAVGLLYILQRKWRNPQTARTEGEQILVVGLSPFQPPDVVIKVFELRYADQQGRLHFHLFSTHPKLQDLPVLDGDLGVVDLRGEVTCWVENHLRILGSVAQRFETTAVEVDRALANVGYQFFEQLLPQKLQDLCWTFRERGVRTVLILSDEPHIPWELIKPYQADTVTGRIGKEDSFWGEAFALTHWLRGRPPAQQLSLRHVAAFAAGAAKAPESVPEMPRDLKLMSGTSPSPATFAELPTNPDLPSADQELAVLRCLEGAGAMVHVLPAQRRHLVEAFERGAFDLLHLACHGSFGGWDSADCSAVLLEDGPFSAAELSPRLAGGLRTAAPLIFFNACYSGRLGFSLMRLGSWGARLVQLGCGAFVGALWPVTDQAALVFARGFYELVAEGRPLGEAVLEARQRVRRLCPQDPSWLAYRCFADPMARVAKPIPRTPPARPADGGRVPG